MSDRTKIGRDIPYAAVILLGAGGTGSIILQNMAHFLAGAFDAGASQGRTVHKVGWKVTTLTVIDGDVVEPKNVARQKFTDQDMGLNKAMCLSRRYSDVFGMDINYVPEYVEDAGRLKALLGRIAGDTLARGASHGAYYSDVLPIIVGAVDNNRSRAICCELFSDDEIRDLAYIDTGNENGRGQTVMGLKLGGDLWLGPVGMVFPQVMTATDGITVGGSCSAAPVQEVPQTLLENLWSATVAFSYVYRLLKDGDTSLRYSFFDCTGRFVRGEETAKA